MFVLSRAVGSGSQNTLVCTSTMWFTPTLNLICVTIVTKHTDRHQHSPCIIEQLMVKTLPLRMRLPCLRPIIKVIDKFL